MHGLSPGVPPHLRRFVVEQDYAQYNAADQAVWRFVLNKVHSRLLRTAHPAYREGLAATGISVERIPSIAEMNEKLGRYGWGAVCVDGFIPPRAFQDFQARAILPIAADIRTREHLVYTPAPDIIHEAAGHAPIVPDPVYAAYLRGAGELGERAFTFPEEERVYQAIYTLSEVKEDPSIGEQEVALAEAELRAALAAAPEPSEATLASRLYWWTAEYGLVGRLQDFRLYGAGLLSSLWESQTCQDPSVEKRPLDASCTEVAYDITRPQPQLFVTPSFEALHDVLGDVKKLLAVTQGGAVALTRALRSREVATFEFDSGVAVIGVLARVGGSRAEPTFLELEGPCAIASGGEIVPGYGADAFPRGLLVLSGGLEEPLPRADEAFTRTLSPGVRVTGRVRSSERQRRNGGLFTAVELGDAEVGLPGEPPRRFERFVLVLPGRFLTAHAGAVDSSYYPDTPFSGTSVPRPRKFSANDRGVISLFERLQDPADLPSALADMHEALERKYPTEWLLRWNLLDNLKKAGIKGTLVDRLEEDLESLDDRLLERCRELSSRPPAAPT